MKITPLFLGVWVIVHCAVASGQQPSPKAAEVNGAPIMAADVDKALGNTLAQLQEQIFDLREKQLKAMIDQKLLEDESAKRGIPIADLMKAEITSHVTAATPAEAEQFYKENSTRLNGDFKTLEEQIRNFLTAQRVKVKQDEYMQRLRAAAKINVLLERPPIFRTTVSAGDAPFRGGADASVTLIEFSDFHCPFCRKVQPVLNQLRSVYGSKVKFVYRDYPLDSLHPQARAASEAALCAGEQGKFWEYHGRLFKDESAPSEAGFQQIARDLGVDLEAFKKCTSSGKHKKAVEASMMEGRRLGVTATPTFFINGRILMGAVPAEEFTRIIDEELKVAAPKNAARLP